MYRCQVIKNIVMDKVTMIKELYTAVGFKLFLAHFGLNSDWLKIFHLIKWHLNQKNVNAFLVQFEKFVVKMDN